MEKKLKKLRKIRASQTEKVRKVNWYVGQVFESSKKVKELVRLHDVETMRDLFLQKNDGERVRVRCKGTTPCYVLENDKCGLQNDKDDAHVGDDQDHEIHVVEDIDKIV